MTGIYINRMRWKRCIGLGKKFIEVFLFFFFFVICYRKNPNKLLGQPTMIHFHHCLLILHACDPSSRLHLFLKLEYSSFLCFPHSSVGKESACRYRRPGFDPWVGKIPQRRKWQPTPVFLPGESHGQRSLAGYSPWGRKNRSGLSDKTTTLYTSMSMFNSRVNLLSNSS